MSSLPIFSNKPVLPPKEVKLEAFGENGGQWFTDGTTRKYKSVSAIKKTLSSADFDQIKIDVAARRKVDVSVIEAEWSAGKERGNLNDEICDIVTNELYPIDYKALAEKYSVYQTWSQEELLVQVKERQKFHAKTLKRFGNVFLTQYTAQCPVFTDERFGFATKGDLCIINTKEKIVYFFDDKADKSIKTVAYKNAKLLGTMSIFDDANYWQYLFQVVCSQFAVMKTKGIYHNNTWYDLSNYTIKEGGIIHWDMNLKKYLIYPFDHERIVEFKNCAKNFIAHYFKSLYDA